MKTHEKVDLRLRRWIYFCTDCSIQPLKKIEILTIKLVLTKSKTPYFCPSQKRKEVKGEFLISNSIGIVVLIEGRIFCSRLLFKILF